MTYGKTADRSRNVLEGRDYKGLIRFARQAAQNYYIHNHIAICDPDAFFASPQYSLEEARCHVTVQALMGGFLFGGDRIESLPKDRLDLYRHKPVLDVWKNGRHAVPLDLFSGADIPASGNSNCPTARCSDSSTGLTKPAKPPGRWRIWKWPPETIGWWISGAAQPSRWKQASSSCPCPRTPFG